MPPTIHHACFYFQRNSLAILIHKHTNTPATLFVCSKLPTLGRVSSLEKAASDFSLEFIIYLSQECSAFKIKTDLCIPKFLRAEEGGGEWSCSRLNPPVWMWEGFFFFNALLYEHMMLRRSRKLLEEITLVRLSLLHLLVFYLQVNFKYGETLRCFLWLAIGSADFHFRILTIQFP